MPVLSLELPQVDPRLCTSCGDCLRVCPTQCLVLVNRVPVVTVAQACIRCQACALTCQAEAIHWQLTKL